MIGRRMWRISCRKSSNIGTDLQAMQIRIFQIFKSISKRILSQNFIAYITRLEHFLKLVPWMCEFLNLKWLSTFHWKNFSVEPFSWFEICRNFMEWWIFAVWLHNLERDSISTSCKTRYLICESEYLSN